MKLFKIALAASMIIFVIGCSGTSLPSDDDNISVVKVTDLRLGYLVKGLIRVDEGEDFRYDLGFCNDTLTMRVTFESDFVEDQYSEGIYEIVGESIITYANGDVMIDTGDSGTLEEGRTYLIEQPRDNLNWQVGSISLINCIVEPA